MVAVLPFGDFASELSIRQVQDPIGSLFLPAYQS